jgi:hypothetical protein
MRFLAVAAALVGTALGLSACGGQGGQALAQQACVHVRRSVADYVLSTRSGTAPAAVAQLQDKADQELRAALPLAAAANSADGSWNSLMTVISEGATIDEGHLLPSLRAQCVVADTNPNVNPQPAGGTGTGTSTPQNVNPEPASPAG